MRTFTKFLFLLTLLFQAGLIHAQSCATTIVFVNEFHYDNASSDVGEFIEVAGTAGTDLTGYSLVLYNGSNGTSYNTTNLSGIIPDEGTGFGAVSFLISGIQNGSPDGFALVNPMGNVVEFLSYEGSFTATNGPANGTTSTDIGVSEPGSTPIGESLQRTGTGEAAADFTWTGPTAESPGLLNTGQTINCPVTTCVDNDPPMFTMMCPGDVTIECSDPLPVAPILMATDDCGFAGGGPDIVFINEFHYDNTGGDTGEFLEVAGSAGTDLSGYTIELYNGSNGTVYNTITLSGVIPNEVGGAGAVDFQLPANGLQNGSPDGFALIAPMGGVLEFLSYEGTITATAGAANGMTSTDVGVSEPGSTPIGESLQLTGTGTMPADFTWTGPLASSPGSINAGQTIEISSNNPGPISVNAVDNYTAGACANEGVITRTWTAVDATGKTTVCTQLITLEDNTPPTFNEALPMDETVFCGVVPAAVTLTAADNCGNGFLPFINEFHYDNTGGDVGEFIEVAGYAGTNLAGYSLVLYNGSNGTVYNTIMLSGAIPDEGDNYGAIDFQLPMNGIQNGSPDGFALVDADGNVLEFLSYEGTFTANGGPADGMMSTDVGIAEPTAIGNSIQKTGAGASGADFTWTGPLAESPGLLNAGQSFTGNVVVVFAENTVGDCASGSTITRTWTATDDCDNAMVHIQTITVSPDLPPVIACQDITVELDQDGNATITANDIDNGTTEDCGGLALAIDITDFSCANIGDNTVTLTATDGCGNTSSCTATVTVIDNLPPVLTCPGDQTIHLDPGACEQFLSYNVSAVDNCEEMLTTTFIGTTFNDNNGFAGNMFDVTNIGSGPIMINSFDIHLGSGAGTNHTVAAYSVLGGYAGNETNAGAWTLMGDVAVVSAGPGNPSAMPAGGLTIQPGEVYGIYIFQTDGGSDIDYTNGANTYADANVQIETGLGRGTPIWTGGIFNPRTWNGNVHYTVAVGAPPVIGQTAGLPSGSAFPIGTTTNTWTATDNYGNTSSCTWSVTIVEYVPSSNVITCNSLVHISLDENCMATVGADQILEGNDYGCYDNYDVVFVGSGLPVILDDSHVGQTIEVMVTNPSGNPCWGYILVEDKLPPTITCYDVDLDCDEALPTEPAPNFSQAGSVMTIAEGGNGNAAGGAVYFTITNSSLFPIKITAFDMNIDGATLVDVYTTPGGHAGNETNAGAWTLAGSLDATVGPFGPFTGAGPLTNAPVVGGTISIAPGSTGIALHALTAMQSYTNGNGANQSFTDGVVTLDLGTAGNALFGGVFDPRVFNGAVYYEQNIPQVLPTDACGAVTVTFTDVVEDLGCNASGFSEIITRTWTATDPSGNSASCTSTYRKRIQTLADIIADLPADVTLECGDALPPVITDIGCDNIGIGLDGNPAIIDICEGSYKMLRKYVLVDWCTNETMEHLQIIKVLDTEGPSIAPIADFTAGTSSNDCSGSIILPSASATDCGTASGNIDYTYSASQGDIIGNTLQNLPLGITILTITATDDCGNSSSIEVEVTVADDFAPIAICDEHTILGIGSDGTAAINATTFDDGSYDNCGIVSMLARRMDNPACVGFDGTGFAPSVPFYCCDVNTTVMVEFQVTDAAGNTNSCMVEVEVQDKINPTIICAPLASVDCSATYLDYIVQGQPLPQDAIDANGEALASDNCPGVTVTNNVIQNTVDCGAGMIRIVWTATDAVGRTSSCIQQYNVGNNDPFVEADITWPLDYTANTCGTGLEPSDLSSPYNYPTVDEGACNNVAIGHHDQVLSFGTADACLKILRKWYVVDWCQADNPNQDPTVPGPGVWHYTQVIKVVNSNDPNITVVDFPAVIDNYDADCGNATATFTITADDDCTPQDDLQASWEFSTGLSGSGLSASGAFANGSYSVTFTVSDGCGNTVWETHDFTVADAKKPTPVCIFGIATTVMPSSGAVTIWASDFESGSSYDNCTAYGNLEFSFSQNVTNDNITIACADIPADGLYPITLYVTDEAGNFDFCSTFINVQDPNGACAGPTGLITGTIENENQEVIEEVTVTVSDNNGPMANPVVTGSNGTYSFSAMSTNNSYEVTPEKDINYLNGVTTYDLVLISKHILGTEILDSPYKIFAADANNTQTVTTLDIVKLRALILHIDDELAANTSWRFVDADHVFANPTNPWSTTIPEYISPAVNGSNFNPANFTAVKVGDVNGTASPNSLLGSDSRTFAGELALSLDATEVAAGETFTVDFKANDFKNIAGYQFTLGFDNSVEFVDVASNLEGLSTKNFGLTKLNEGVITTSWNSNKGVTVANGETLFSITFRANAAVNTKEALSINSRYTESEAYNGSDLYNVVLEFNGNEVSNGFELFQNTPNPFKAETTIGFNMPAAGEVTLKIYDVSGRVLRLMEVDAVKGFNSVNVTRDGIDATGVLYYQLETATETATKKMILVD